MWILYKPIGVDTDMAPGSDLESLVIARVGRGTHHHVGRLDRDTSGVLILSADGDKTHALLNAPTLRKSYIARVGCSASDLQLEQLVSGVVLTDGLAKAVHAEVLVEGDPAIRHLFMAANLKAVTSEFYVVRVVTCEGRNRIVRRMLAAVGLPVLGLHRERFGSCSLGGDSVPGDLRCLSFEEVDALMAASGSERALPDALEL